MVETISIDNLVTKNWIIRLWEESKDPYLNRILSEEWCAAGVPARREINLMVPESDYIKTKWWELPVIARCYVDGSADIIFRFKPSADTYDAARIFIRASLYEIEAVKDLFNSDKMANYFVSRTPYIIEAGKMKINELRRHFKK